VWRLAVLHHGSGTSLTVARLRECLQRQGLTDGQNCVIDVAGAERRLERLPDLVEGLLNRGPDVVVAIGAVAALAAQRATSSIPVLHATVLDPASIGLNACNLAGVTTFDREHGPRQVQLLQALLPPLSTVVCFVDPDAPHDANGVSPLVFHFRRAALGAGLRVRFVALKATGFDAKRVVNAVRQDEAEAMVAFELPAVLGQLSDIAGIAERCRLPTVFPYGHGVRGLVMLGPGLCDAIDPLVDHVVAVLRGVDVATLPTRRVRHERLMVDQAMAQRLGLTIPAAVLARATPEWGDDARPQRTDRPADPCPGARA